jgi:hypothetical protein
MTRSCLITPDVPRDLRVLGVTIAMRAYKGLKGLPTFQCPHGPTHILSECLKSPQGVPRDMGRPRPLVIRWAMGARLLRGDKLQTYLESFCSNINLCGLEKMSGLKSQQIKISFITLTPNFNRTLMTEQNLKRFWEIQPYYFTVLPTGAWSFLKKN